jgi:ComF family protein
VCRAWPSELAGVASAVWLEPTARKTVHLLKYEGWHRITEAMAGPMAPLPPVAGGGLLIPIPLGAARLQTRGYNQSAVLARSVGRSAGMPVAETVLVRVRDTQTQTRLTPEEREANLRDAFRVAGAVPARVILVDDVFTTGATLVSAARALLEGGARAVTAITFARAELPLAAVSRLTSH